MSLSGRFKTAIMFFMLWFFLYGICFSASKEGVQKFPDIFAHNTVILSPEHTFGRIMVAGGDAVVSGKVVKGIVLVDGNLTIKSGATVTGKILVIGGSAEIEQGANNKYPPRIIAPQGHPLVPVLVLMILFSGGVSLIILPLTFGIIGHFFIKTSWYIRIKEIFLKIERRWPILYIVASLGISAFMLAVFTMLAWETLFYQNMAFIDDSFVWLIRYYETPLLDKIMISISDIGFGTSYIVIVALSFLLLMYLKRWRELGALVICLSGGAFLSYLLKNLFHRARPDAYRIVQEAGFSFPSGHALASMCFYGMAAFILVRTISTWPGRVTVITLAVILCILIGISRIYLGVHYPTDVAAGYAAGSMWLAFCISLLMWWEKVRTK